MCALIRVRSTGPCPYLPMTTGTVRVRRYLPRSCRLTGNSPLQRACGNKIRRVNTCFSGRVFTAECFFDMKSQYLGCRPGNRLQQSSAVAVTRHKHFGVDEGT